jgi:hypothetical protein
MREDPDDHRRLLDGGDDLQLAAALRAVFEGDTVRSNPATYSAGTSRAE